MAHTYEYYQYEPDNLETTWAVRVRDDFQALGDFSVVADNTMNYLSENHSGFRARYVEYVCTSTPQRLKVRYQSVTAAGYTNPAEITYNALTWKPRSRHGEVWKVL
jgi:hypothetical protein